MQIPAKFNQRGGVAVNRGFGGSLLFQRCIWRLLGLGKQCGPGVSECFSILAWLLSLFFSVLVGVHYLLFRYAEDFPQIRWLQAVDPGAFSTVMFAKIAAMWLLSMGTEAISRWLCHRFPLLHICTYSKKPLLLIMTSKEKWVFRVGIAHFFDTRQTNCTTPM